MNDELVKKYISWYLWRRSLGFPEYINVQSQPVVANKRKLKAYWSPAAAKDLKAYHTQASVNQIVAVLKNGREGS